MHDYFKLLQDKFLEKRGIKAQGYEGKEGPSAGKA